MRTIRDYLQDLPEPARSLALQNLDSEKAGEWSNDLPAALKRAFLWYRSPEGYNYWNKVLQYVVKGARE